MSPALTRALAVAHLNPNDTASLYALARELQRAGIIKHYEPLLDLILADCGLPYAKTVTDLKWVAAYPSGWPRVRHINPPSAAPTKAETSESVPPRDAFACATIKAAPADAPTPAYPRADVVLNLFIRGLGVIEGVSISGWDYIATALESKSLKGTAAFNASDNMFRITGHTQCTDPYYTFSYRRKHVTLDWQDSRLGEIIKTIRRSLDAAERTTMG